MNWDYLAGWFDADGSVSIQEKDVTWKNATTLRKKSFVSMTFGNTDFRVIQTIRKFLGLERLKIHVQPANTYPMQKKTFYRLQVAKKSDQERILRELAPRCMTKKQAIRQALLLLVRIRKGTDELPDDETEAKLQEIDRRMHERHRTLFNAMKKQEA